MRIFSLIFVSILLITFSVSAQKDNVTLKGVSKQYAGFNLSLQHINNFITNETEEIGNFRVDDNGNFSLSIYLSDITYAFIDLGVLRGFIYLEPNTSYEIIFPPYTPKKEADRFNPYFTPENVIIGIANNEALALNKAIIQFDEEYDYQFNTNAFQLFNRSNTDLAQQIVSKLDSLFPNEDSDFLKNYKKYKYAKLSMLSRKREQRKVISEFYLNAPVCFENPAYWETFNLLFKNFFSDYFFVSIGKELKAAFIKGLPFDSLSVVFSTDSLFQNGEFREMVLLKGLYDAFYSGHYDEEKVIALFDQAAKTGFSDRVRSVAQSIYKKVNHLRVGSKAPDFTVYTTSGKERKLSSFKGKFVYLNFCNTENYTCKKDFQVLNAMYKQMKRDLTIVSIATDRDPDKLAKFIKTNKYKWNFLYFGDNGNIIFDYNVKALPSYFLIDPEGNILLSPAPAPEENFGALFYEVVKDYRYKKLRKERPKERSIYDF